MIGLRILHFAGRHGPALMVVAILAGGAWPALADAARPVRDLAVFGFTLGAFLKVDAAGLRAELRHTGLGRNLTVLAWTGFGCGLLTWGALQLLEVSPDLALPILLCALAPPVGGAAALAAMLGLSAPLALFASVGATLLAPVAFPLLATLLGGAEVVVDPWRMLERLLLIVGGAALASLALRRWRPALLASAPVAVTGVAVLSLVVFGFGAMQGVPALLGRQPGLLAFDLMLALALNAGFQLLGLLLFWPLGRQAALTIGLVTGNRNIGLAWAAMGAGLTPRAEIFIAMAVLPIFLLPALVKWVVVPLRDFATAAPEPRP